MRRKTVLLILSFALIAFESSCKKPEYSKTDESPKPAIAVATMQVSPESVANTYEAVGTVESDSRSVLSAKVMGHIKQVAVEEGDVVKKGQVLIVLDSSDIRTQMEQAAANLEAAKANADLTDKTYVRIENLYKEQVVARQTLDEIKAKKAQASAGLDQAQQAVNQIGVMLGYTNVLAPFSGVVVRRMAEPGQLAAPGAPLLAIEDNTDYRLAAQVEESFIESVKIGDEVKVAIDALADFEVLGKITEIVPAVDPASRTFIVKIGLPRTPGLRSGLYGKARFARGRMEALRVPEGAVVRRGQLEGLYLAEEGRARFRLIRRGRKFDDGTVEILSGIAAGDELITSQTDLLEDGRQVEVEQ